VIKAAQLRPWDDDLGDDPRHFHGRKPAKDRPGETFYLSFLFQEPINQTDASVQLMTDNRSPQRYGVRAIDFPQQLGAAVQIVTVGKVALHVAPLLPGEDAVGADLYHASADIDTYFRQLVRKQRIDGNAGQWVLGRRQLLDYTNAIDYDIRLVRRQGTHHRIEFVGINVRIDFLWIRGGQIVYQASW
jgi:hypothetical protein